MKNISKDNTIRLLKNNISTIFCLFSAIVAVTICSKSSPLYPFNDWVDANCYFTVGKSIFKGLVPYRDLMEQKGPFIYFIHGFASLISYKTFFGVYLFELVGAFFFFYFSNKTFELFCGKKSFLIIPFLSLVVYSSAAFCHGDSAEELCFPFIAFLIFIAFRNIQTNIEINIEDFIKIGICAACVFWTKFTLCGIFLGWFIPFTIHSLIKKRNKNIINSIIFIILGLFIGTVPYLIYFGINHSLKDLFTVYIYNNIFLYSEVSSDKFSIFITMKNYFQNLIYGFQDFKQYFSKGLILLLIGGIYCIFRKWTIPFLYTSSMFFFAFFFIFIGGRHYPYYSLGLAPILCLGFIPFFLIISNENKLYNRFSNITYSLYGIIFILIIYCTDNRYLIKYNKTDLPQYKFSDIILNSSNATLLNYGKLDIGLYTTTGITPDFKYFCQLNIPLQEMYLKQNMYIEQGLCDFIVTFEENKYITKLDADKNNFYKLIDTTSFWYEGQNRYYSLFKLVKN